MGRDLRKALLAAMAVSLLFAVAAQTTVAAEFHSSSATTKIISTPDGTLKNSHHVIDVAGGLLNCGGPGALFTGTASASTVGAITLEASYGPKTNCLFFGQQTQVEMNGCDFIIRANKTLDIASKAGRNCANEPITWSVPSPQCHVFIGPQTGLTGLDYTNNGGKTEITLEFNVPGITYTSTGSGCIETGTKSNGTYTTGNTWLTGSEHKEGGAMVSLWYE